MRALPVFLVLLSACAGAPERDSEPGGPEAPPEQAGGTQAGLQERFPLLPITQARTDPVGWRYRVRQGGRSREERWTGWFFERRAYPGDPERAEAWNQYVYGPRDVSGPYEKVVWFVRPGGIELQYLGTSAVGLEYDPPILILPAVPEEQRLWTWEGTLDGAPARAECGLVAEETVQLPAGVYRSLHYRETHEDGGPVIDRWFVRGIGLVKLEQREGGELRMQQLLTGFER